MGALRDQTVVNIRERAGRRKQNAVRRLYSRPERLRVLFGILGRLEGRRGLEGRPAHPTGHLVFLLTSGVGVLEVFPGVSAPDR